MSNVETQSRLEAALQAARPRLSRLLDFYRVPPDDAHGLLEDLAMVAAYRMTGATDPERWLSLNLQARCLGYWRRQCLADEGTRPRLLETPAAPEFVTGLLDAAEDRFPVQVWIVETARTISLRAGELAFYAVALGLTPEEIETETGEPVQEVRRTLYRVLWRGLRPFLGERRVPPDEGSEL